MRTASELREELTRRAAEDPDVRRRLLDDPKGAIETVLGIHIPEGMAVRVHEDDAHTAHLVLPPPAALDLAALEAAAGGFSSAPEELRVDNWI